MNRVHCMFTRFRSHSLGRAGTASGTVRAGQETHRRNARVARFQAVLGGLCSLWAVFSCLCRRVVAMSRPSMRLKCVSRGQKKDGAGMWNQLASRAGRESISNASGSVFLCTGTCFCWFAIDSRALRSERDRRHGGNKKTRAQQNRLLDVEMRDPG